MDLQRRGGNPQHSQLDCLLCTLQILLELTERELEVNLKKSSVSHILAHWGLSPSRPVRL
jgi:hypothetical protein